VKFIQSSLFILVLSISSHAAWDQSLMRWEGDCGVGLASGCAIAASMYEKGEYVTWNGSHNEERKGAPDLKKALKLYDEACKLGDRDSCGNCDRLRKKIQADSGGQAASTGSEALKCDVDGDGTVEWLYAVKEPRKKGAVTYYQLQLLRRDGSLLWAGPRASSRPQPLRAYRSAESIQMPEIFADVDHDGKCELLISAPREKVGAAVYHRYRWEQGRFVALSDASLLQKNPPKGGTFVWKDGVDDGLKFDQWYIIALRPSGKSDEARATLISLVDPKHYRLYRGRALLRFTSEGAALLRWIEAPSPAPSH